MISEEGKKAHTKEQIDTSRANGGDKAMNPLAVKGDTQGGDARVCELVNDDYSYAELQQDLAFIIEAAELEQDLANIIDADAADEGKQQNKADDQEQKREELKGEQEEEKLPESRSSYARGTGSGDDKKKEGERCNELRSLNAPSLSANGDLPAADEKTQ